MGPRDDDGCIRFKRRSARTLTQFRTSAIGAIPLNQNDPETTRPALLLVCGSLLGNPGGVTNTRITSNFVFSPRGENISADVSARTTDSPRERT